MFKNKPWQYVASGISIILFLACNQAKDTQQITNTIKSDSIPLPAKVENITKGNMKVFYIDPNSIISDSIVKNTRELRINGDIFLKVEGPKFPIYVYTSLMQIAVLKPSAFRITAYDKDQGQSVESLSGEIKISKNYSSPFPDPDTLRINNLYMVNSSIDLSEKEHLDDDKLAKWWEGVNK